MRVPDEVLSAVAYIGFEKENGKKEVVLCGTGFFVAIPIQNTDRNFIYLVTAKHVPAAIGNRNFCIRVNTKENGSSNAWDQGKLKWYYHPTDDSVDVAVIPWAPSKELVDYLPAGVDMFVDDEKISKYSIGIGDEVFISGLFTRLPGTGVNIPIIRSGIISMTPKGRVIPTQVFGNIEGYLIEARSLGGISGSPTFVYKPDARQYFLLGLMHGHWDIPEGILNEQIQIDSTNEKSSVNMGIAIVVPAKKILETLQHPELIAMREKRIKEIEKGINID